MLLSTLQSVLNSPRKVPCVLSNDQVLIFSTHFNASLQYQISRKSIPWEPN